MLKGRARQRNSSFLGIPIDFADTFTKYTISILLSEPSDRSEATLKRLEKLTSEIDFFKNLKLEHSEAVHMECCKYMRYEMAFENSYVFNYGDQADKFYILVEGSVEVRIPDPDNKKILIKIADLATGQSFGELALMKNQPRMASIYCTSMCHFATLSKEDYDRILAVVFERQLDQKLKFLSSLQIFEEWTKMSLTKLSYFFHEIKNNRKGPIYKEGTPVTKIYLVKKGELKVFKTFAITTEDNAKNSPRQLTKNKRLDLAIVSTGEFLGIEDLISGKVHTSSCEIIGGSVEYFEIDTHVRSW